MAKGKVKVILAFLVQWRQVSSFWEDIVQFDMVIFEIAFPNQLQQEEP